MGNSRAVVVVSAFLSIVIVVCIFLLLPRESNNSDETSIVIGKDSGTVGEGSSVSPAKTSPQQIEVETDNNPIRENISEGNPNNSKPNTDLIEYLEEIGISEESIAKAWFDVRQDDANEEQLQDLVSQIKSFLDSGRIPMVVDKFPLLLTDTESYGFQHNILWTPQYPINLITLVAPAKFSDLRVVTFVMAESNGDVSSFMRTDIGIIPSNFGRSSEGDSFYYIVGGDILNEDLFTNQASVGVFGVLSENGSVGLVEIEADTIELANAEVIEEDYILRVRPTTSFPVFLYNEFEYEGIPSDDLYLITSDSTESYYKIGILEGKVGILNDSLSGR